MSDYPWRSLPTAELQSLFERLEQENQAKNPDEPEPLTEELFAMLQELLKRPDGPRIPTR